MALGQRRMVHTGIWQNTGFSILSDKAKLLYIGTITFADDDGRLKANSLLLKSQVFPFDEKVTQMEVRKLLNSIVKSGLVEVYRAESEYYIQHPNWHKYQSIRKDLYKPSDIPPKTSRTRNGRVPLSKDKLSKDNIREEASMIFLKSIPQDVLDEWYIRFDCSKKALVNKGEELWNYCKSHGRMYKDYKAFMLNALKRDFPERKEPPKRYEQRDGKMYVIEKPADGPMPPELENGVKNLVDKMTLKTDGEK